MRFFTRMFVLIMALAGGVFLGARYSDYNERHSATAATVEVQKIRITHLQQEALRLRTALLLRDALEEAHLKLPRDTYRAMTDAIADASLRYEVPPETILAVIRIESGFDVNATSEAGAVGLMQLLPSTAEEVARELRLPWRGEQILKDPAANIQMGTYYLTKLLGRFNDLTLALAAYNEGPERVAGNAGPSNDYARRVMAFAAP